MEVCNNEIDVAKPTDWCVGESLTYLDRATRVWWSELHDAEHVVWRIVDVEREADLIDVEPQRSLDVAHRRRDHFD